MADMNIGFDAKRAYHNNTGLGNYSRTLITGMVQYYPQNHYYLFNPTRSAREFAVDWRQVTEVRPEEWLAKKLPSVWRTNWIKKDIEKTKLDVFHGLSHEIPVGMQKTAVKSVVTMHDLIFERYPNQYKKIDIQIYRRKFQYALEHSDRVIAISEQTKRDLVEMYKADVKKIEVCYQSCDPAFSKTVSAEEKEHVRKQYHLPQEFFLYVGSIIERKNLLTICEALKLLKGESQIPLVVIGNGKGYKQKVEEYIRANGLEKQVIFLNDQSYVKNDSHFQKPETFAAIYQMATALIYPSHFEGFGIPVLEALWSRVPVITSNVSCMPETGGDGVYYVNPSSAEEIAEGMRRLQNEQALRDELIEKGWAHAQNFTIEKCTRSVMNVYEKLVHG